LVVRTTRPPKRAIRLWNNIYGVVDIDSISEILRDARSSNDTRLYLGRAQWAREQLRGELLEGAWSVVPVRTDLIFEHDSAKVWRMLSQHEHVREIDTNCSGTGGLLASTMCREHLNWYREYAVAENRVVKQPNGFRDSTTGDSPAYGLPAASPHYDLMRTNHDSAGAAAAMECSAH
jgi:hypothetical protein